MSQEKRKLVGGEVAQPAKRPALVDLTNFSQTSQGTPPAVLISSGSSPSSSSSSSSPSSGSPQPPRNQQRQTAAVHNPIVISNPFSRYITHQNKFSSSSSAQVFHKRPTAGPAIVYVTTPPPPRIPATQAQVPMEISSAVPRSPSPIVLTAPPSPATSKPATPAATSPEVLPKPTTPRPRQVIVVPNPPSPLVLSAPPSPIIVVSVPPAKPPTTPAEPPDVPKRVDSAPPVTIARQPREPPQVVIPRPNPIPRPAPSSVPNSPALLASGPIAFAPVASACTASAKEKQKKGVRDWVMEWGLPGIVGDLYARRGIREFYDWQLKCLCNERLVGGGNLVYTLPTSSGKTLVAEIALLRCLVLQRKMAFLVLPFVSIVVEKTRSFEALATKLDFTVEAYHGSHGTMPVPPGARLLVGTIEKLNGVINSLVEEKRVSELGCVVVDEVHMVSEADRGANLEILLSKILHVSGSGSPSGSLQLLAMSATVPNVKLLGTWLRAETFEHAFRPVPLREFVKVSDRILDCSGKEVRRIKRQGTDFDGLAAMCAEVIPDHSVLVFCSSKAMTEKGALHIVECLALYGKADVPEEKKRDRDLLLQKLAACSSGGHIDSTLARTIPFGVAFHNAGLMAEEREQLEEAFRQRVIVVLCSTSTLAAGVNLPARRVILRSPYIAKNWMGTKYYKQMVGRAGRAGLDDFGESFLCVDEKEKSRGLALVHSDVDNVTSQLMQNDRKGLERLVLEGTCGGYASTRKEVSGLIGCTMAAAEQGIRALEPLVGAVLQSLFSRGFVSTKTVAAKGGAPEAVPKEAPQAVVVERPPPGTFEVVEAAPAELAFEATPLGQATYHSCFSPEEAKIVHSDLARARRGLVLIDELHLCFLMTPISGLSAPDWAVFNSCISTASEEDSHQLVLDSVGGSRSIVERRMRGSAAGTDADTDRALSRFYSALILLDLLKETPLGDVAAKYHVQRGTLQTLMASASSFANMTVAFCKRLGWWDLEAILSCYVKRLNWGVKPEIVPLTEIRGVGRARARALWNAGFRTVRAIATAKPDDILKHVSNLGPFRERAARMVVKAAKELLDKQARELQKQAEEILAAKAPVVPAPAPAPGTSVPPSSPVVAALSRGRSGSTGSMKEESQLFGIGLEESLSDDLDDYEPLPSI